jgi:hypothetical protein
MSAAGSSSSMLTWCSGQSVAGAFTPMGTFGTPTRLPCTGKSHRPEPARLRAPAESLEWQAPPRRLISVPWGKLEPPQEEMAGSDSRQNARALRHRDRSRTGLQRCRRGQIRSVCSPQHGAGGGGRTRTGVSPANFKSAASTNSATPAGWHYAAFFFMPRRGSRRTASTKCSSSRCA